jgi:REP element-mobilizing transposase RayT
MPHTYTKLAYHCIFSTSDRRPLLTDDVRERVQAYIRGIVREIGANAIAIGGVPDHVHLLLELPASLAVADAMRLIKSNSSKWIREAFPVQRDFGWQSGYSAFTVSASAVADVARYVANQASHHRTRSFDEEIAAFLRRHGMNHDASDSIKNRCVAPDGA